MASDQPFLYGPAPDEELDEAYRYARLSPDEQIALRMRQAQVGAEKGAESAIRGVAGLPASAEQNRQKAAEELRALALKATPGTADFYRQAADIFRKYGMVAESETMTQRLDDAEMGKGEQNPAMKAQRAKDQLMKRLLAGDESVKPAIAALDRWLSTHGQDHNKAADPEFIRLINAWEAEKDPAKKTLIKRAIDAWLENKKKSGGDMTPYQQWRKEKDEAKTKAAEGQAISALQATIRALDGDINEAKRLLVHPGLAWITGQVAGVGGRFGAAFNSNAAGAHAILMTIHAQTFIRALQDLKATSKTGASGLGQLTEKEGEKIQNAKVALDPQQPTDQFKRTLQSYIDQLEAARAAGESELNGAEAEVPVRPAPISDRPGARGARAPATAAPSPAPKPAADKPKRKFEATRIGG